MPGLDTFSDALAIGVASGTITKNSQDVLKAGGYAAWVQAVTGRAPRVTQKDGRVILVMDKAQVKAFQAWFEGLATKPKTPPSVSLALGPVLKPVAIKYAIIIASVGVAAGFTAAKLIK